MIKFLKELCKINRKLNRICALALCSILLSNFAINVSASELLNDEKVEYVEVETDFIIEENIPEYDSVESAINDKLLMSSDEESFDVSDNDEYINYDDIDNEQIIDLTENFNEEIGLTDEEVEKIYEMYVIEESVSDDARLTINDFENFANYAVEHKIIEDSVVAKASITKSVMRSSLRIVVYAGGRAGYTLAAKMLGHSLQDNPSGLYFEGIENSTVKKIVGSTAFKTIYDDYQRYVRNRTLSAYTKSGKTTFSSPKDLHLALNKVDYIASGSAKAVKINRRIRKIWKVKFTFTDKYDFEVQAWKNSMTDSNIVTALNNYAAYGQKLGAIVPYNVKIKFDMSFVE